jgi:two-component system, OmpR family, sensor kinase
MTRWLKGGRSIEARLQRPMSLALGLGALLVSVVAYWVTLEEMHEVFDSDLQIVAEAMAAHHVANYQPTDAPPVLPLRTDDAHDTEIVTLTWLHGSATGGAPTPQAGLAQRHYASDPRVQVPYATSTGLQRMQVQGEGWYVYTHVFEGGAAQAAQRVAARQQMALETGAQVLPITLALFMVVALLLRSALRTGLATVNDTAHELAQRSSASLAPLPHDHAPQELLPLVEALNKLMTQVSATLETQRRFTADAAHELRTPITALRLQAQLVQRSPDAAQREAAMADLFSGIDRAQRLVEQLLQMARTGPDAPLAQSPTGVRTDLQTLAAEAVQTFEWQARHAQIDLGLALAPTGALQTAEGAYLIDGDTDSTRLLLHNLIDNALRYTPAGGRVDVSVQPRAPGAKGAQLQVSDDGPGVAVDERTRVFDRFYRGRAALHGCHGQAPAAARTGSGLGLSIVAAVAQRQGAQIDLAPAAPQSSARPGLRVTVQWPDLATDPSHASA